MDLFDEILVDPGAMSRSGGRFQPKIKPRPKKQPLAPQLSMLSQDKKETISDTKSCHDGKGDTESIISSSQLPMIEENKEFEDDLFLDTESAKMVDSMQSDFDSLGNILPTYSTADGPVGSKNVTDNTENLGVVNCSDPSASTAHEAMVLDHTGLGSKQTVDGHLSDGKIVGENVDIFYGLEYLDDFHNQPKNEANSASLKQATISNEDGDLDKQRLEIEEFGADTAMGAISADAATPSGPAYKYRPKLKMRTTKEDDCTQISQPEISIMLPQSSEVISCDTRCMHETSIATHSDGVLNDSSINFDDYTPVNPHTEAPIDEETFAFNSYGDILVDDFNSDDHDEMSRGVSGKSGKEKPSMESNISQQQERFPQVGEEYEHFNASRKLKKQVSHQLDESEDGADENRNFPNEPSNNCDGGGDGDSYNKNETSRGGTSRGKKALTKSSKPSSDNGKPSRKRKGANKAVPDLQAEKRPKKFSHSTRRNRRQVNKVLLETPEDEIDFQKISLKDLIIYHDYKEKLEKKEAASTRSATNQRPDTVREDDYYGEEGSLASEQGRGTDDDETPDIVDMTSAYFNYQSFMDKTPRAKWSKQDTELFYEAIRQFGTDFSLIQQLFPGRTRRQIKLKFKNEERHHPLRLSDAITNRAKDHSHFLSLIGQLQEATNKAKHDSNQDEFTENTGDEELQELSPETNEEEVSKPGEAQEKTEKEECVSEVHSPLKSDGSDDEDLHRWDDYKFDY